MLRMLAGLQCIVLSVGVEISVVASQLCRSVVATAQEFRVTFFSTFFSPSSLC